MHVQQILTTPYTPHYRYVQQQKPNTTVANANKSSAAKVHAFPCSTDLAGSKCLYADARPQKKLA